MTLLVAVIGMGLFVIVLLFGGPWFVIRAVRKKQEEGERE